MQRKPSLRTMPRSSIDLRPVLALRNVSPVGSGHGRQRCGAAASIPHRWTSTTTLAMRRNRRVTTHASTGPVGADGGGLRGRRRPGRLRADGPWHRRSRRGRSRPRFVQALRPLRRRGPRAVAQLRRLRRARLSPPSPRRRRLSRRVVLLRRRGERRGADRFTAPSPPAVPPPPPALAWCDAHDDEASRHRVALMLLIGGFYGAACSGATEPLQTTKRRTMPPPSPLMLLIGGPFLIWKARFDGDSGGPAPRPRLSGANPDAGGSFREDRSLRSWSSFRPFVRSFSPFVRSFVRLMSSFKKHTFVRSVRQ